MQSAGRVHALMRERNKKKGQRHMAVHNQLRQIVDVCDCGTAELRKCGIK